MAGDHNRDGDLQGEQAAGVVDQAFSFDDVRDSLREAKAAADGGGCDSVGGADDGAENKAELPGEVRQNPARGDRDAVDRETHQAEREHGDAHEVVAKIAPGSLRRRRKKQRWEEQQEYDVGIQFDVRHARQEAEDETSDYQDDGVRRLETLGANGESDHANE